MEDGRVTFVLGDVSGKGLPAALLTGVIHGAIRASHWTGPVSNHEECTQRLNELLCAETARERFASLFWCYYDPHRAVLRYVNAGHPPPLLIHEGAPEHVAMERLTEGGPVLGLLPPAAYGQGEVSIRTGDLLVIFSDGIVEAANAKQEEFGEDRLLAVIRQNRGKPAAIVAEILAGVRSFVGDLRLKTIRP